MKKKEKSIGLKSSYLKNKNGVSVAIPESVNVFYKTFSKYHHTSENLKKYLRSILQTHCLVFLIYLRKEYKYYISVLESKDIYPSPYGGWDGYLNITRDKEGNVTIEPELVREIIEEGKNMNKYFDLVDHSWKDPYFGLIYRSLLNIKELLNITEDEIGYYELYNNSTSIIPNPDIEKIQWFGTDTQLIYLFELLGNSHKVDPDFFKNNGYVLISSYFKNRQGKSFKNRNLSVTHQNFLRNKEKGIKQINGKPRNAEVIEDIVDRTQKLNQ